MAIYYWVKLTCVEKPPEEDLFRERDIRLEVHVDKNNEMYAFVVDSRH